MTLWDDCGKKCPECGTGCSRDERHVTLPNRFDRQHHCPNPRCFNVWPK
jgi:hypothetical protein